MLSSDFEKEVQQKFGELKFTPPEAVWENVEASLPRNNRRRLLFFWLLLGLLAGSGIWYYMGNNDVKSREQALVVKEPAKQAVTTVKQPAGNESQPMAKEEKLAIEKTTGAGEATTAGIPGQRSIASTGPYGTSGTISSSNIGGSVMKKEADNEPIVNQDKTGFAKANGKSKPLMNEGEIVTSGKGGDKKIVKEENLQATNAAGAEKATVAIIKEEQIAKAIANENTPLAVAKNQVSDQNITQEEKKAVQPASGDNSTTSVIIKKKQPKWEFGLHAGGGISNVKMGLFEKSMYASDPQNSNGSTGGGAAFGSSQDPAAGFAYAAGFFAQKAFAKRWFFYSGLQYQYASNKILVGSKVDSAVSLDFSNEKLESSAFYRGGASTSYTNKYHFLQVPLLVHYTPMKTWPLFLEAGGSLAWLAGTNGLQYNAASNAYITSMEAFNRWQVSGNLGAGVRLAQKTNHPLHLGYRFHYTATSLTKEAFGKQHLTSSLLYLDMRLHK